MTTAGRTPGVNHAKKVREYFEANRNRDIALDELRIIIGEEGEPAEAAKTRGVVSYLRTKLKMKITVVKRGRVWRYNKNTRKRAVPYESIDEQVEDFIKNTNQPPEFAEKTTVPDAGAKARRQRAIAGGKVNHTLKIGEPDEGDRAAAERLRAVANKLTTPVPSWHKVPEGEPVVTFRVVGTLLENGQLVLQGTSAGVQGVWMARRVD